MCAMGPQIVLSQEPVESEEASVKSGRASVQSADSLKLTSSTKVVPRK